ncbi:hypothetical protein GCM10010442_81250 [Kitasatospora kifunensis]
MAGGQSGGRPVEPGGEAGEADERLTGGLSGGEWWRVDGPWRVLGGAPDSGAAPQPGTATQAGMASRAEAAPRFGAAPRSGAGEDGVYLSGPVVPPRPTEPPARPRPAQAPAAADLGPEVPVRRASHSIFRKRTPAAEVPREPAAAPVGAATPVEAAAPVEAAPVEDTAPAAWLIAPATPGSGRPPTAADFPGWDSVMIEFPPDDTVVAEPPAEERPIPGQRGKGAAAEPAVAEPTTDGEVTEGQALPRPSLLAGRRPSPLLLLAAAVLVGGAVTGVILVLLAGWGLAYLSARLGNLTKKFAVFGIPMITMTASSIWFWGRSEGRWGEALAKGAPVTHAALDAAPGVLRLAGVLSALFLLAVAMRRRPLG